MDRFVDAASGMAVEAWGDPARSPDLVFVHANGFNAHTYRTLLEPLGEARRVLAVDLRGHGLTRLEADWRGRGDWTDFQRDLAALLGALPAPVRLPGHSMGGTGSLLTARHASEQVRDLVLLDPVILPRAAIATLRLPGLWRLSRRHPWAKAALRRRDRFPDREAAFAAYLGRGSFRDWPDAVLRDYVETGFRDTADGEVALSCTREWESSNYSAQANDPWGALARAPRPVTIWKGERGSTCSLDDPGAARMPNVRVETAGGGGHFFPMTEPEAARAALIEGLA